MPGSVGSLEEFPVAFADPDPLEGDERAFEQAAEFGEHFGDAVTGADGDDHHRDVGVAVKELRAFPVSVGGAVDAEQDGGAGEATAVQQVADRDVGGGAEHLFLPADIDGEFRGLVQFFGQRHRADLPPQQP